MPSPSASLHVVAAVIVAAALSLPMLSVAQADQKSRGNPPREKARCKDAPSEAEGIANSTWHLQLSIRYSGAVCLAISEPIPALPVDVSGRRPELPRDPA